MGGPRDPEPNEPSRKEPLLTDCGAGREQQAQTAQGRPHLSICHWHHWHLLFRFFRAEAFKIPWPRPHHGQRHPAQKDPLLEGHMGPWPWSPPKEPEAEAREARERDELMAGSLSAALRRTSLWCFAASPPLCAP